MKKRSILAPMTVLIFGDILTLAVTTAIGFAFHNARGSAGLRILATFLPILAGWLLVAASLDLFHSNHTIELRQLWRPVWAMFLAVPLAAWLRGLWLNTPISPIFVAVIGGINVLAMLIWRALYAVAVSRMMQKHG